MNKQEFLAMSLPNGLKCVCHYDDEDLIETLHGIQCRGEDVSLDDYDGDVQGISPIVRPIISMAKECVQSDYNNGKPFVPIVELAKMFHVDKKYNVSHYLYPRINGNICRVNCCVENTDGRYMYYETSLDFEICELRVVQQLIKWHFWPNMDDEEVVYVDDEFNPYKP